MKSLPIEPMRTPTALGRRLRAVREQNRLTIDQVASFTGLSKGFLSRVERDLTSPSVASLVAICQVLGVPPGQMLEVPETEMVVLEDAPAVSLGGDGITEKLLTPPGQRNVQIIHAVVEGGGRGEEELYTMDCIAESLHILEGEFVLVTSDAEFRMKQGDTVTLPGSEPHTWYNPTEDTAKVLWILTGGTQTTT
ncbi:MAG: helix-turn-helix domain-containing protein [Yaniella sp.]|uniref:helix-turn-helix domain-containing protein n=1 Tax=Yaniella sp. TaxID=2773929 RepID=UPI0026498F8E|nr:helix-turn-helix transcriptional regulator [Yaniella sp.]MDN5732400.1 helix-turn-helix domain-containing protein [Yaniella sp.]MDN5815462.1 helix-turn-helix domain-containing protein [Yaniella sp.]MDN5818796.1 helix-turn-helix domain-containing protein [Yaniella sp.]MDN5890378.1 helix-turn-helix domain-containing protein [Yaniella sp.]MDN5913143.1 helix-turn-helix domain-containing protein [Yaniella sp.]